MEMAAASAEAVMATTFAISFSLSIVLNGVMSQMWNIFNTLQIILALPLLPVIMSANIEIVREAIDKITNVQFIEKETIN